MDLVRKSARSKNPVMHKNNNKGAELAGEMLAGSAFSVHFIGNADGTFYETRQDNRQNSSE